MVFIKKFKSVIMAAALTLGGVLPLYSSAADADADREKPSYTLSAPRFGRLGDGSLAQMPNIPQTAVNSGMARAAALPESFDLREAGGMTSVKDQGTEGTCWTHSAIASAETSVLKYDKNVDISEYHLAFYTYYGDDQVPAPDMTTAEKIDRGGNCYMAANLWSQWIGPVKEKRLPYGNIGFFNNEKNVAKMKSESDYHLRNAYIFDYDYDRLNEEEVNSRVKELVYSGLSVDMSLQFDMSKFYSGKYRSTRSDRKPKYANHSVAIAGWDDNFPKENFTIPASRDGAWLVKNSWGDDMFDNGYMWVSYDDRSLCEFAAFELDPNDEYAYNYRHDSYVGVQTMSAQSSDDIDAPSYIANIFTADEPFQVEAVCVNVWAPETEYEITVYSGLTDPKDPTSGTPSAVTQGIAEDTGVLTIPLDTDAAVEKGRFSVVMKLYSPVTPYVVPLESSLMVYDTAEKEYISLGSYNTYEQIKANTATGESFFSADGSTWNDVKYECYEYGEDDKKALLMQLEYDLFDDIRPNETDLYAEAEETYQSYVEVFSKGTLSLTMGNIPMKVLGNPLNTVDFSQPSGTVEKGTKIYLSTKDNDKIKYSLNGGKFSDYSGGITVTEPVIIAASADGEHIARRCYIPEGFEVQQGDVDLSGMVDASDASFVLAHYSSLSTGGSGTLPRYMEEYADMDDSGLIDSSDASKILEIYAKNSTMQ